MRSIRTDFTYEHRSPPAHAFPTSFAITIALAAVVLLCRLPPAHAFETGRFPSTELPPANRQAFERNAALQWEYTAAGRPGGPVRAWQGLDRGRSGASVFDQRGTTIAPQPAGGDQPWCDIVLAEICRGWPYLLPEAAKRPAAHTTPPTADTPGQAGRVATLSLHEKFRVYLVQPGDSLWKIARRFSMNYRALAEINGLNTGTILQVGRPLKVKATASRELRLNFATASLPRHPALLEHIRMIDGRPAPRWFVTDYVADVIDKRPPGTVDRGWEGRTQNLTIVIQFRLVRNLVEGRARKYQPLVLAHARKYDLDPALIMAMIHTESGFDPNARSNASAYGLMQLVPHTAGREAYDRVHGGQRELTPQYLFDPDNNIALGTAYFHILRSRYLGAVTDPLSRTYCAVAAYHAGPSGVGKAFLPQASIKEAIAAINRLTPADVYQRLVAALPSIESRNYLRTVIERIGRYSGWHEDNDGTRI